MGNMTAARSFIPDQKTYDVRFLMFEFLTGFLLRKRQVELVQDFANAALAGTSSVHQMAMGGMWLLCSALPQYKRANLNIETQFPDSSKVREL